MGTQAMNTYGFEYDKLGRLKNTLHYIAVATTPTNSYTERGITYDLNGNITTLKRYAASEATPEDDYQYIYTGNKLTQIAGTENNADTSNALYVYDQNGNMIFDGLKNLQISYNFLNLPSVVNQASAEIAKYSWFADGSKYSVITPEGDGYYYTGSLIYASNNGNLQIESTDFAGGRINLAQTGSAASGTNNTGSTLTQDIHYHHTDHLGSVRAITNQNGETVEQNAYYPFGSRHTFGNTYAQTTNRFKFNGKEEQTSGNLQYLDYGARMYDANIGRWMVQDPLAEQMYRVTPYRFSLNNPINFIDPNGLFEISSGKIEKGDNLTLITQMLNNVFNTNLSIEQIAKANNIRDIDKINEGDYIILPGSNIELSFNLSSLYVVDQDYHINIPNLSWNAISGRKGYQDKSFQEIPNKGPIPEGEYIVDSSYTQSISDISIMDKVKSFLGGGPWPGLKRSWGEYRTWIFPNSNTNAYGRNNFSIHGGQVPGSAGCIDLTSDNNSFHSWLLSQNKPIKLIVKY